ncbi:MAG: AMP-binding protein, partial [Betaproteobacteria bacterium]
IDSQLRAGRGDAIALRGAGVVWTYAQLSDRVDRIAHVLRSDFNLPTGARVLLRGPNHPMLAACWLGVLKAGCIAVTTMPLLRARELGVIAERAQVSAALCDASLLGAWNEVRAARPGSGPVLGYGEPHALPGSLENAMARHGEPFQPADTAQDDVALIAFTSGTTGQPKGTMHFHRDCLLIADVLARHLLELVSTDVFIGTPPLAFTFGLGGLLIFPLRAGASAVLEPQWTAESLLAGIEHHQATICFTAPTFYRRMAAVAQRQALQSLRITVSSGEMLPADTRAQWLEATGIDMTECLGSTELLHAFIGCRPGDGRAGATGRVVPGYQACILDDQGQPVPPGTLGRLAVRGPTGCRYLDDPRQSSYVQQGWNLTGDAYLMDSDGYFWYQSRTDDMIISAGYNIAGPEVEDVLLTHPDVAECGVVGAPDTERGQVVM